MINICVSNEFFDALPIHIFSRGDNSWEEVLIDGIDAGDDIHFRFVRSNGVTASMKILQIMQRYARIPIGQTIEVCPESIRIATMISDIIGRSGGLFLTADYGSKETPTSSIRVCNNFRSRSYSL